MPAILRIFLYQTDASLSLLGLCGSYDQVGARRVGSDATVPDGQTEPAVWNNMPCLTVCVVYRPSGPPPIVSIISSVISTVLSRFFGVFGSVVAAGNRW